MPPEPRPRALEGLRFYVDEDCIGLGYALMWMRPDVITCGQEPLASQLPRGIWDIDWIPVVARLGLVAITANHKIRTHPRESPRALECGTRIVGLAGKNGQGNTWQRATLLVRHWDAIENHLATQPNGPWWLSVSQGGVRPQPYRSP